MKTKLLSLLVALIATSALWASNTITYTATSQLSGYDGSLSVGQTTFGPAITSHTFSNGKGTIVCVGEITTIGEWAFAYCSGLTSVTIPNSVTTIGEHAFYYCSGLTSVTIPNSVTTIGYRAFCNCSGLTSVTIPNSVTTIEGYAFAYCSGLTSVTIPNSVTTIGNNAFSGCNNIVYNGIATGSPWGARCVNSYVEGYLVYNDATKTALHGCSTAATGNISIPNSVTKIESSAFSGCIGLTSITIPASVTFIGTGAFFGCSGLTTITIPASVTVIGAGAFNECTGLTSFDVDAANTNYVSLNGVLFNYAKDVLIQYPVGNPSTNYIIPSSVTKIETGAFDRCYNLTSVTIPSSVTEIETYAFFECTDLTSITIPSSVTKIKSHTFYGCTDLTSVIIPNSVTSIGDLAFYRCNSLTSITIPNSVTEIEYGAFEGCSGLTSIACEATTPPTCGSLCFEYVDHSIPLYVPAASIEAYKTANRWKDFTNIQAIPTNVITYTATSQLSGYDGSLSVGQTTFGPAITSHTFSNGKGTIVCAGEITTIGYRAFYYCDGLTSVTIPNSVTTIGEWAFYYCSGLTSVNIPNSVTTIGYNAFRGCKGLTSITIPNSVTTIGNDAFWGCSGLTSVTIPNSVTTIGDYAFNNCSGLTSINVDASNTHYASVDGVLFNYAKDTLIQYPIGNARILYTIPNSVTTIGEYAFDGCSGLTSVTIPNSVTTIGTRAFCDCSSLTLVTIPNSVTTIGEWAFQNCSGLPVIDYIRYADTYLVEAADISLGTYTIQDGTRWIGDGAFIDCRSLTSITIPNSVTTIGTQAFVDCSGLTSVIIPNSVTTIGLNTFGGCSSLTSVTIPNSVTTIGNYAFRYCSGLTSITIPNSVTKIGSWAFYDCSGLTSLTIPNSVTTIGNYAFRDCSGLTSITIGNSVTTIGEWAFNGCSGLADIYCYATIPPTCEDEYVFSGVSQHCYIHVPVGTVRAYELAVGWSHFLHFFEISEVPVGGTDQVGVEVTNNTAVFSWPVNPIASSYTLVIKKNDEVFCTLTFNSLGQLVGMAFAPARGANNDSSAQSTAYGYSFMVSNLDASSTYDYTFTAKDASNNVLTTTTGQFKTGGTATDLLPLLYEDNSLPFREGLGVGFVKFIHNGHLLIERNGILYNAHGARVK